MTDLDRLLGACYSEAILHSAEAVGALTTLKAFVAQDEGMREEASRKLGLLTAIPADRCFLSAQYRKYLTDALEGKPHG